MFIVLFGLFVLLGFSIVMYVNDKNKERDKDEFWKIDKKISDRKKLEEREILKDMYVKSDKDDK